MRRITYFLVVLLLLPFSLLAQEWKSFSDTSIAFTAKYPDTWVNKIKEGKRVFFTSPAENEVDSFYENVNISMSRNETYGKEILIKDAIPSVLEELANSIDDFTKETQRYFKWNGYDACELIYTGQVKGSSLQVKITQWFCFSKGRLFVATYTSLASNTIYVAPAQKILQSIRFR
ncbi:MAG: hypothetical protein ABL876_06330 [Chitinophagaceae bacterium]